MEKAITATSKKATATITQDVLKTLETALAHHQDNNLKEAEKLYKKALTEGRNQPDIAVLAAIFYQQIGRHKYKDAF